MRHICFLAFVLISQGDLAFANAQAGSASGAASWSTMLLSIVTAALIAFVTAYLAYRFDRRKTANQELIKKRIEIYDIIVPALNDLLCHALCVGDWESVTPPQILERKRIVDKKRYVYASLFSIEFTQRYYRFMSAYFQMYAGSGRAKLRIDVEHLRDRWGENWQSSWDEYYVTDSKEFSSRVEIVDRYDEFLACFAREIGAVSTNTATWSQKMIHWRTIIISKVKSK